MSASTWLILAIIFFTLAAALFVAAVIMFIVMNIPAIISDLTGRTLAKGIQNIRDEIASENNKNARAANRRANSSKPFSIGSEYLNKGNETNISSLAHASRRLDKTGNTIKNKNSSPKEFSNIPSNSMKTAEIEEKQSAYSADILQKHSFENQTLTNSNEYSSTTLQLDNSENRYMQKTSQLDNTENQYMQATSVLGDAGNQYMQAISVLGDAENQYMQATSVLGDAENQYMQATSVLGDAENQYMQATSVLGDAGNQYMQATSVLGDAENQYMQATSVLDNIGNQDIYGTTVLPSNTDTTVLGSNYAIQNELVSPIEFRVVRRISVTHCDEVMS